MAGASWWVNRIRPWIVGVVVASLCSVGLTTLGASAARAAAPAAPSAAVQAAVAGARAVMLVVDTSGSMAGTPLAQAKSALTASVDALQPSDAAGLRAYGGDCGDAGRLLAAPATDNRDALKSAIAGLSANGGTPTPEALTAAVADFPSSATNKLLILVSDGQSTCGDPCPVAQQIKQQQGVNFTAYTVGFNAGGGAEDELQCIARVTGGQYFPATDTGSLQNAINSAIGGSSGLPSSAIYGGSNPSSNASVACSGDPVNCATGDFTLPTTDLAVPGRGLGLLVTRNYNSLDASADGLFGYGWASSLGMSLTEDATSGAVTIRQENGSQITFTKDTSGEYVAPSWVLATLAKTSSGWTLTRRKHDVITFDSGGALMSVSDLNGEAINLGYLDGKLATATASGRRLRFTLDVQGRISTARGPLGRTVRYAYDAAGDLTAVTDPAGGTIRYGYDAKHRMTSWTDALGARTANTYDDAGRVVRQVDPVGAVTSWTYTGSTAKGTTKITGDDGRVIEEQFSGNLLVSRTVAAGTSEAATTTYTNEPGTLGVSTVTDPLGRRTTNEFDADGNTVKVTLPDGSTVASKYDALDDLTSTTDPSGATLTRTYDSRGNLTSETAPTAAGDAVTRYTYAQAHPGDVTSVTDPEGRVTSYRYTRHGDIRAVIDGLGHCSTLAYNKSGELIRQTDAAGAVTRIRRDDLGRATQSIDPSGARTSARYDPAGRLIAVRDRAGGVSRYEYDAVGRKIKSILANGTFTTSRYDNLGELVSEVDVAGRGITHAYDQRGLATASTMPGNRVTRFSYDAAGQMTRVTDPAGRSSAMAYTPNGDLARIDYSAAETPDVSFGYDANGTRTSMSDGTGTSRYRYDPSGQITGYTSGAGNAVGYTYDRSGLLTRLTYPGGKTVRYRYDNAARLTAATDWRGQTFRFGYSATDLLRRQTAPNGVTARYRYDADSQLSSTSIRNSRGKTLLKLREARDPRGLLTGELAIGGGAATAQSYGNDAVGQLTGLTSIDVNGDRSTTRYSYSGGQIVGAVTRGAQARQSTLAYTQTGALDTQTTGVAGRTTTASYGYDALGERTSSTVGRVHAEYGYDQAGNLTSFTGPKAGTGLPAIEGAGSPRGETSGAAPKVSAEYRYDGDGLRASSTVHGTMTTFTHDPSSDPARLLTAGDVAYVYCPGGRVLEQVQLSGTAISAKQHARSSGVLYLHADQLGSTRLLTDERGKARQRLDYTPYGQLRQATGRQPAATAILFAGGYRDAESGLYYLINRYYDPATAQFLTIDPLLQLTGSTYGYVGNSPLNLTDPSGLCWGPACFVKDHWRGIAQGAVIVGGTLAAGACIAATAGLCGGAIATAVVVFGIGAAGGAAVYGLDDTCHTVGGYVASAAIGGVTELALGGAGSLAAKGIGELATRRAVSAAEQSAYDYATGSAKLDHIFAAKHNFDPLIQRYGSREAVVQEFLTSLRGLTPESGVFEQQIIVGGQPVVVRGAVVDGIVKIGTAFTP